MMESPPRSNAVPKTVLIGLDGATFSILDPLMADGHMPFLRDFLKKSFRANLLSTPNPLTPPAWVSMVTGRSPGNYAVAGDPIAGMSAVHWFVQLRFWRLAHRPLAFE